MKDKIRTIYKRLFIFLEQEKNQVYLKWAQRIFTVGIITFLAIQLLDIGYGVLIKNIPANPLFHLLFLISAVQLPFFEVWIYSFLWQIDKLKSLPIFFLKNTYNKEVLGYSGEVFLFIWAKKYVQLSDKELLKSIKDANIISSVASTLFAVGLLSIFLFTGKLQFGELLQMENKFYRVFGTIALVIVGTVAYRFRTLIISISAKQATGIFLIHIFRLLATQVINLAMFFIVIPEISLELCFTLIAGEIIIMRVPFIPNRDIVYTSLSLEYILTTNQGLAAEIMSLLVVKNILGKLIGFAMFNSAHILMRFNPIPAAQEEVEIEKIS